MRVCTKYSGGPESTPCMDVGRDEDKDFLKDVAVDLTPQQYI